MRWTRAGAAAISAANAKGLSLVAAGVAFYMILSLFPGAALVVSVYGLIADPAQVRTLIDDLAPFAPPDALELVRGLVDRTLASGGAQLTATAAISFLIALWSAGSAIRALMAALQIAFPKTQQYGFVIFALLSLAFTLLAAILVVLVIAILVFAPLAFEALRALDTEDRFRLGWTLIKQLEPAILIGLSSLVLASIYFAGARVGRTHFRSALLAALATTLLWFGVSRVLAYYIANFADFGAVYGPFAAVAGLMLWFWISAFLVLLGAELTAALERIDLAEAEGAAAGDETA